MLLPPPTTQRQKHTHTHADAHTQCVHRAAAYRAHQLNNKHAPGTRQLERSYGTRERLPDRHGDASQIQLSLCCSHLFSKQINSESGELESRANFCLHEKSQARAERRSAAWDTDGGRATWKPLFTFTHSVCLFKQRGRKSNCTTRRIILLSKRKERTL